MSLKVTARLDGAGWTELLWVPATSIPTLIHTQTHTHCRPLASKHWKVNGRWETFRKGLAGGTQGSN